jgi:hypothetical protein
MYLPLHLRPLSDEDSRAIESASQGKIIPRVIAQAGYTPSLVRMWFAALWGLLVAHANRYNHCRSPDTSARFAEVSGAATMVASLTRGTGLDKKAAPADGTRMLLATLTEEIQKLRRRWGRRKLC